jgi:hypothetical protein
MRDHIMSGGDVPPVHLTTEHPGIEGKNMIAGGHHRIAVGLYERPDALIPVLHHKQFSDAVRPSDPVKQAYGNYS